MIVCRGCGMHTWIEQFGCSLPGCSQYAVLVNEDLIRQALDELDGTSASAVKLLGDMTQDELDELGGIEERDGAGTPPAGTTAMPVAPGSGAADASATDVGASEPSPSLNGEDN